MIDVLGGKCSCDHVDCWHVGSCTVSDRRCLHIDHVNGDGKSDREKHRSSDTLFRYYLEHFDTDGKRIQLLCANCNVMKVLWNDEMRQASPYGDIVELIEHLPSYSVLLASFHAIVESIMQANELFLLSVLKRYGLAESPKHPLSCSLAYNWSQQKFYKGDSDSLSAFLEESHLSLESVAKRLAIRVNSKTSDKTDNRKRPDNTLTATITR